MKKVLCLVLMLGLAFALYACGGSSSGGSSLPPFTGTTTTAVITNATTVQAIVDSAASAPSLIYNGITQLTSIFDMFEVAGVVTMTTATSGTVNGCGGGGSAAITGLTAGNNGGSGTFTFNNFVPYDVSDNTGATCLNGVVIVSGSMYVTMTENWTLDVGCGCDTGSSNAYLNLTDVNVTNGNDGSNRTYRGTLSNVESATATTQSWTDTINLKFTDNTIAAPNETMLANYKEVGTSPQNSNTENVTVSGSLYVPGVGKVTIATVTPIDGSVPIGMITLSGDVLISMGFGTNTWLADLDGNGDTLGVGETGVFSLTPRY